MSAVHGRARAILDPVKLGGRWCTGTFQGIVKASGRPVARFSFRVKKRPPSGDRKAPKFGGLKSAFACTPGPQHPGQTTPYTLRWDAATDDVTPSSQIVYDIYESPTSGGEGFGKPTWVTPPGATTFRTPGLPSHGSAYFVVRARDQAGNEDHNRVERRGIDPCV